MLMNSEEISFYYISQIIARRKWLIAAVILVFVLGAVVINTVSPKVYAGKCMIKLCVDNFSDILSDINFNDAQKLKNIFPTTYESINAAGIARAKDDSSLFKVSIYIYAADTEKFEQITSELGQYVYSMPLYRAKVHQSKEQLTMQSEYISDAIANLNEILKAYNKNLVGAEKVSMMSFNPVELYNGLLSLKIKQIKVRQDLESLEHIQISNSEIDSRPVKPHTKRNIILAVLGGLFTGCILAFFSEFSSKQN
jgi:capsular polysaccharide biosynthesis protein